MDDPRLSLADVVELVRDLPHEAIEQLAQGPFARKGMCRVCGVLQPLLHSSPAAAALYGWHEFFEETPALDRLTKNWQDRPTEEERHEARAAFVAATGATMELVLVAGRDRAVDALGL